MNELHLFVALEMAKAHPDLTSVQVMSRMVEAAPMMENMVWGNLSEAQLTNLLNHVALLFFVGGGE